MYHDYWHAQHSLSTLLWFRRSVFWYGCRGWCGRQLFIVKMLHGISAVEPCAIAVHTPTTLVCKMTMTIMCNVILFAAEIAREAVMRIVIAVVTIRVRTVVVTIAVVGVRAEVVVTCVAIGTAASVGTAASTGTAIAILVILISTAWLLRCV